MLKRENVFNRIAPHPSAALTINFSICVCMFVCLFIYYFVFLYRHFFVSNKEMVGIGGDGSGLVGQFVSVVFAYYDTTAVPEC